MNGLSDIRIGYFYQSLLAADGGQNLSLTAGPGFEAGELPGFLRLVGTVFMQSD